MTPFVTPPEVLARVSLLEVLAEVCWPVWLLALLEEALLEVPEEALLEVPEDGFVSVPPTEPLELLVGDDAELLLLLEA